MPWLHENRYGCSYESWVNRHGGIVKFLDEYLTGNRKSRALEFGSGNTTRVLARRCDRVITVDSAPLSAVIPYAEQASFDIGKFRDVFLESNVMFINCSLAKIDMKEPTFFSYNPDLILFDLGCTLDDKYLYQVCYERLRCNILLDKECVFVIDNSDAVGARRFIEYLKQYDGYSVSEYTGWALARKA